MGRCCYLRFEGSDHRPMITYFNNYRLKKGSLFRFNRALVEKEEVSHLIETTWNHFPLDSVIKKLKACRRSIIQWSKEQQNQSNLIIKSSQIVLEIALSAAVPDAALIEKITAELRQAYLAKEQFCLQRSQIQWLKQGDRNTGFFHVATRSKRMINTIPVIENADG